MLAHSMDARAKSYELAPGVVLKFLPFRPVFWVAMNDAFLKHVTDTGGEWGGLHNIFIVSCPLITSIQVATGTEVNSAMQCFVDWLNGRTADIVENWLSFQWMVDVEIATSLWEAYGATRDDLPKAPAILQVPAPVPVDEHGNVSPPIKSGGRK